jgi:GcrA cell cycle regulator
MEFTDYIAEKPPEYNKVPFWTDDRVAALRQMHADGWTFSQIGRELGTTRNAVIGRAWRLHLRARLTPEILELRRQRAKLRRTKPYQPRELVREDRPKRIPKPEHCDLPVTQPSDPVSLIDLKFHHCRWPCVGWGINVVFCGDHRTGEGPYCGRHAEVARSKVEFTSR